MSATATATATVTPAPMKGVPLLPGIHTKHYPIVLPAPLLARLTKPVKGMGGWQDLITDIQGHIDGGTLELPEKLMRRMIPYAVKFGSGGYQGMIRWILCLVLEAHGAEILGTQETLKGTGGQA